MFRLITSCLLISKYYVHISIHFIFISERRVILNNRINIGTYLQIDDIQN